LAQIADSGEFDPRNRFSPNKAAFFVQNAAVYFFAKFE
jgi:hypothetical protein